MGTSKFKERRPSNNIPGGEKSLKVDGFLVGLLLTT